MFPQSARFFSGVGHGAGRIDKDRRPHVRLLDVLLDVIAVAFSVDPPVQVSQIISGNILAVLGELDGKALVGAGVASRDGPLLGGPCQKLEATNHIDHFRREQLGKARSGRCLRNGHYRSDEEQAEEPGNLHFQVTSRFELLDQH